MDKQMDLIDRILKQVKGDKKYNYYAYKVKEAVESGKYDNLLSEIETNREDIDYKKLLHILINDKDNSFEIKTISDIEKYEKIRGRALDSVINLVGDESLPLELFSRDLPEIELYRLSCIERLYGQDLRTAKEIAEKYGNNIDDISRPELKNYIISLQKILSENDINQLKRLLQISEIDTKTFDTIGIEDELQAEYGRLYEGAVLHIDENTPLYQGNEFGDATVYDVSKIGKGIMLHVVDAAIGRTENIEVENFYDFWNRQDFEKDTSCSFVSPLNPNKRYPAKYSIAFGFVGMEDYLLNMGTEDIASTYKNGVTIAQADHSSFMNPILMAKYSEAHGDHDEFVYMTNNTEEKNGEIVQTKKQPDYIVVAKNEEGFIDNIELAVQAHNDFKNEGINVPIVFADIEQWKQNPLIQDTVMGKVLSTDRKNLLTQLDDVSTNVIELLDDRDKKENQETNTHNNQENLELKKIKTLADSIQKKGLLENKQAIEMLQNRISDVLRRIIDERNNYKVDEDYLKKVEELFIKLGINSHQELDNIKEHRNLDNKIVQSIIKKIIEEKSIQDFFNEQGYTEEQGQDLALRDIARIKITEEIMKRRIIIAIQSGKYDQENGMPLDDDVFNKALDISDKAINNLISNSTITEAREKLDLELQGMGITNSDFSNKKRLNAVMDDRYAKMLNEAEQEAAEQEAAEQETAEQEVVESEVEPNTKAPDEISKLKYSYSEGRVGTSDVNGAKVDIKSKVEAQSRDTLGDLSKQ